MRARTHVEVLTRRMHVLLLLLLLLRVTDTKEKL